MPGEHLVFDSRGVVGARTREGRVTIETLKLNRDRLVHERKRAIEETIHQLDLAAGVTVQEREDRIKDEVRLLLSPSKTYLAARRGCIRAWIKKRFSPRTTIAKHVQKMIDVDGEGSQRITAAAEETIVERSVIEQTKKEQARASLGRLEAQYITRIELHNFKAIEDLTIEISSAHENYTPWVVLLGENGMGKSSILKAVALALMDKEYCRRLKIDASKFVRHGQRSGYVRVYTTAHTKPFEINFNRDRSTFTKTNDNRIQTLLLGYGGTRLLPRGKHRPPLFSGYTRIDSLFDPFLPLLSAESWFLSLDRKSFGYSARVIKDLLTLDNETKVVRRDKTVKVKTEINSYGVSLEDLSDGYQSMLALSTDMMRLLMKGWELAEKAYGIVLLDEIDVHLHPRWKMQITSSLRRAFPRVQFVVTTHDPLCLKGTKDGEVKVLSRNDEQSQIGITGVDVPPGATADQLLTGFWFGLSSTIDSETLGLIDEHRLLLTGRQTPLRVRRRLYLEDELRRRLGVYADTSLDRMAQSVAAELMQSTQRSLTPQDRVLLRKRLLGELSTKKALL
jgi:predicted ATPase